MKEIKRLEKLINYIKNADYIDASQCFDGEDIQALENLLTRYKQMAIENQSYKDYYGNPPCYDDAKYIPKSKVKEKIEEINNENLNYSENEYYLENEIKGYAMEHLRELLRGE